MSGSLCLSKKIFDFWWLTNFIKYVLFKTVHRTVLKISLCGYQGDALYRRASPLSDVSVKQKLGSERLRSLYSHPCRALCKARSFALCGARQWAPPLDPASLSGKAWAKAFALENVKSIFFYIQIIVRLSGSLKFFFFLPKYMIDEKIGWKESSYGFHLNRLNAQLHKHNKNAAEVKAEKIQRKF